MLMRDLLRGLRCNALLDLPLLSRPCQSRININLRNDPTLMYDDDTPIPRHQRPCHSPYATRQKVLPFVFNWSVNIAIGIFGKSLVFHQPVLEPILLHESFRIFYTTTKRDFSKHFISHGFGITVHSYATQKAAPIKKQQDY